MKSSKNRVSMIAAVLVALSVASVAQAEMGKQAGDPGPSQGVVNVNTATAEQLALLPGVGPSRAQSIIEARQRRPFRRVNELIRVRGIGRATLQRLRPYVRVNGETTLNRSIPMRRAER